MLSAPPTSFHSHYQSLVASGAIEPDAAQAQAAEAFAALDQRLANYRPARRQGLLGRLFADKNGAAAARPLCSRRSRARQDHADGSVF